MGYRYFFQCFWGLMIDIDSLSGRSTLLLTASSCGTWSERTSKTKAAKKRNKDEAKQNWKLVTKRQQKGCLGFNGMHWPKRDPTRNAIQKVGIQLKVLKAVLENWQGEIPIATKYPPISGVRSFLRFMQQMGRPFAYGSRSGYNAVNTGVYSFDKAKPEIKVVFCKP